METWTIKKLLNWSTDYFASKGCDSPRLDAEVLLSFLLKLRRLDLYLQFERPVDPEELKAYKELIKRRLDHEPVAYIVGKKEFWSRDFFVSPDVLIPRPDTESLIEVVLDEYRNKKLPLSGFEIGLGSGVIAVTLLSELPQLTMVAVEISPEAIHVAQKNADYHGVSDRLKIIQGDFLNLSSDILVQYTSFDLVVSNPPYCRNDQRDILPRSVKDFEPHLALFADEQGLKFYPQIAEFAAKRLNPSGLVAVETGEDQGDPVSKIFTSCGLTNVTIKKDMADRQRVVSARGGFCG